MKTEMDIEPFRNGEGNQIDATLGPYIEMEPALVGLKLPYDLDLDHDSLGGQPLMWLELSEVVELAQWLLSVHNEAADVVRSARLAGDLATKTKRPRQSSEP